ncbi:MAG: hypothetical protein K0B37_16570, partial [Bacteroidales bacterium]|nr:hypothetical protein [Bacteroidales bacterium]
MKHLRLLNQYFLFVLLSGWLLSGAAIRANAQEVNDKSSIENFNTVNSRTSIDDPVMEGPGFYSIKISSPQNLKESIYRSTDFSKLQVLTEAQTIEVTNTNDSGEGSLRWAITEANQSDFRDVIVFDIPGAGPHYIQPTSWLPDITKPIVIDGTSQPGYAFASPKIVIDGSIVPPGPSGVNALWLKAGSSGSLLKGLVIINYPHVNFRNGGAIVVDSDNNVFEANFIGLSPDGITAAPNLTGIQLEGKNNVVGGDSPEKRNVISGNAGTGISIGIRVEGATGNFPENNLVIGNYLGTNTAGNTAVPNVINIQVLTGAKSTTIGGLTGNLRNVISGATNRAIIIGSPTNENTKVVGNYIGTNINGTTAIPNNFGIHVINGAENVMIGGEEPGAGNVISGNNNWGIGFQFQIQDGEVTIYPENPVTGTQIKGNLIGVDASGMNRLSNQTGISFTNYTENIIIGGLTAGARNIISGNNWDGISIGGVGVFNNLITGNYIGTNLSGDEEIFNEIGIAVRSSLNVIGGDTPEARNIISGNSFAGIFFSGVSSTQNLVKGNYIGLNAAGTNPIPNQIGVSFMFGSNGNIVGGELVSSRNIISGNLSSGVQINGAPTNNNLIQNNFIGTNISGTSATGNNAFGITIEFAVNNQISNNLISGNGTVSTAVSRSGIRLLGASGNTIKSNLIGTNLSGDQAIPNQQNGIYIDAAFENHIGGPSPGDGNLISGNTGTANFGNGIYITGIESVQNQIFGNKIGTDLSGNSAISNSTDGILVANAVSNQIGGINPGEANIISGNTRHGISILGGSSSQNQVIGNNLGLKANGTEKLGNGFVGINITGNNNLIKGNTISGNNSYGVQINVASASLGNQNQIIGNLIGTNTEGQNLGNSNNGIYIVAGSNNKIGGILPNEENIIAFNTGSGIQLISYPFTTPPIDPVGNAILSNSIYSNTQLGIRLAGLTIPANDAGDADTGPNKLQNFPEISQASYGGGQMEVTYFVPSAPANSTYPIRVEFFRTNTNERQ